MIQRAFKKPVGVAALAEPAKIQGFTMKNHREYVFAAGVRCKTSRFNMKNMAPPPREMLSGERAESSMQAARTK